MKTHRLMTAPAALRRWLGLAAVALTGFSALPAAAQPAVAPVWELAASEQPRLMDTLKALVEIESGSTHREGLDQLSALIGQRLKALGGAVQYIEPTSATLYRMDDTPADPARIGRMVQATFRGTGSKRILLLAHMDTGYPAGMLAQQPYRAEGNKAYGLGIADAKQGVATLLHTAAMLQALKVRDYDTLTVFISADEKLSSPASRQHITRLGAEHDVVMSFDGSRDDSDKLALASSGIGLATLTVRGRASHAGDAPERGLNALYELSHQLLQLRDLSVPERGLQLNWTVARAGMADNMIPPGAQAWADIRLLRMSDLKELEKTINERIRNKLLPESEVSVTVETRRPPLEASGPARVLAAHARNVYREIGKTLAVASPFEGSGTHAAFAALKTKAPVIERFGLQGFGAHGNSAQYILINSIQPRLYLATRMVMDIASCKVP